MEYIIDVESGENYDPFNAFPDYIETFKGSKIKVLKVLNYEKYSIGDTVSITGISSHTKIEYFGILETDDSTTYTDHHCQGAIVAIVNKSGYIPLTIVNKHD